MKRPFFFLLPLLATVSLTSEAQSISSSARQVDSITNKIQQQGDKLQQFPSRYFSKVSSKTNLFNRRITKRTEKALRRLQKQEEKINSKLSKIDSVAARGLALGNSIDSISHLQEVVKNKVTKITSHIPGGKYIPYLDSLQTSLNFLGKYQSDLSTLRQAQGDVRQAQGDVRQAQGGFRQAQADVRQLEGKLNQVRDVQQYIQQRQQLLTQALSKYGSLFTKNLGSINKEVYYYKATIENYKELWQHPGEAEAKAVEILNKMPAFTKFMQEHSMIAGLFRIPANYGTAQSLSGLQTRSMVEREIQQQLQQAGPNGRQQIQQQIQQAQQQIQQLQNKLPSGASAKMPDFKPNDLKSKTLFQRLSYGTNLQFEKSTGWYPTTSDIAAQIGYKFSKNGEAGIGTSFKLGWTTLRQAQGDHKIHFTAQGVGIRSYLNWQIEGSLYIAGGYEMDYNKDLFISPSGGGREGAGWARSALLGIERKYKVSSPFGGNKGGLNGDVMLLFNFLYKQQVPPTRSPLVFRIGYEF